MKVRKRDLRISENHPSLLLSLPSEQTARMPPIVINQDGILVDGYRRIQIAAEDEIEAIEVRGGSLYEIAREFNLRTRAWDEVDCFLWTRWAHSQGIENPQFPQKQFAAELWNAPEEMLRLMAERKLLPRQIVLIQQAPLPYREFFARMISNEIQLNANETAVFFEMAIDLKKILNKTNIADVFSEPVASQSPRQRGEALLKEMRALRYPYFYKKSEEFTSSWRQLDFGPRIRPNKNLFLERGILEITLSSDSLEELRQAAHHLCESLQSPAWEKIWKE